MAGTAVAANPGGVNSLDGGLQAIVEQTNEGSRKVLLAAVERGIPAKLPAPLNQEYMLTSSNEHSKEAELTQDAQECHPQQNMGLAELQDVTY